LAQELAKELAISKAQAMALELALVLSYCIMPVGIIWTPALICR
jgi:hypothetical protein